MSPHRLMGDIPVAIRQCRRPVVDRGPWPNIFICVDLTNELDNYVAGVMAPFLSSSRCETTGYADSLGSSGVTGGRIAKGVGSTQPGRGVMTAIPADAAARVDPECQEPQ
jgi:hypothetical protein